MSQKCNWCGTDRWTTTRAPGGGFECTACRIKREDFRPSHARPLERFEPEATPGDPWKPGAYDEWNPPPAFDNRRDYETGRAR